MYVLLLALLSALLFGVSTPASKALLASLDPFQLAGLLYLGAAVGMAPVVALERRTGSRFRLDRSNATRLAGAVLSVACSHLAALLTAGACICWALDNHMTALIDGITPARSTLAKGAVAGATNLGIGVVAGHLRATPETIAAALAVGALSYGASITLYIRSAHELGATRAQAIFASAPFVSRAHGRGLLALLSATATESLRTCRRRGHDRPMSERTLAVSAHRLSGACAPDFEEQPRWHGRVRRCSRVTDATRVHPVRMHCSP